MNHFATIRKQCVSTAVSLILVCGSAFATISLPIIEVKAQNSQTPPEELQELVSQMDEASNARDIEQLMEFYSPDFENTDGLRYSTVSEALEEFWQNYSIRLTYDTQIISWERRGDELIAETETTIEGSQFTNGRRMRLVSTIRSRQYFQDNQLIRQEILSEKTDLTSGPNPPQVDINIPEVVNLSEQYSFDVIVKKPLNDNVLLGAAIEENTGSDRYLKPSTFELEVLSAGGIFKSVTAPSLPGPMWLSAILVRNDGIRIVTRRVRIEE